MLSATERNIVTIDVIILSYAKNEELKGLTEQTVATLITSEDEIKFNIVVIESEKKMKPEQYNNTLTIYPKSKFGFNKYLNIGLANTNADYVCLSNNDLIFTKGWASEILNAMDKDKSILSASPICPSYHPKRGYNIDSGNYYGWEDEISGWFILLKRRLLDTIGPLDEKIIFWYADNDYSELLKKFNINHALVSSSVVQHLVESTLVSLDYVEQKKNTDGSFIYYDYKWNHHSYFLYVKRSLKFQIQNKIQRFKFLLKHYFPFLKPNEHRVL